MLGDIIPSIRLGVCRNSGLLAQLKQQPCQGTAVQPSSVLSYFEPGAEKFVPRAGLTRFKRGGLGAGQTQLDVSALYLPLLSLSLSMVGAPPQPQDPDRARKDLSLPNISLVPPQGQPGPEGSPGAKGYPGRQVQYMLWKLWPWWWPQCPQGEGGCGLGPINCPWG